MKLEEIFAQILINKPIRKPKKSSLIKEWLGTKDVPHYLSIRLGNYLELLFNTILGPSNILNDLSIVRKQSVLRYNSEEHQVDILARINNTIYHRELKTNTDLDRGKKRDTRRREKAIYAALVEKYPDCQIDSCVFCPFIDTSRQISGLGKVEGLADFITTFNLDITIEEFKALGKLEKIHNLLLLK